VLWTRLSRVIEDVANCCIKVNQPHTLLISGIHVGEGFTDEKGCYHANRVSGRSDERESGDLGFVDGEKLDEKPSFTFWTTLAKALEAQTKVAAKSGCSR
jgi:hypothetical protein